MGDSAASEDSGEAINAHKHRPEALCPIRPGDYCSLCVPGADGPENCGLVYLVMHDEDLSAELNQRRAEYNRVKRIAKQYRS